MIWMSKSGMERSGDIRLRLPFLRRKADGLTAAAVIVAILVRYVGISLPLPRLSTCAFPTLVQGVTLQKVREARGYREEKKPSGLGWGYDSERMTSETLTGSDW